MHRDFTLKELDFLLKLLKKRFIESKIPKHELKQRLHRRVARDLAIINELNKCLEATKHNDNDRALYLCKENKLYSVIASSADIINNHFDSLIQGKMPIGFKKSLYEITILETDKGDKILTGSFKSTCLKGVIITMLVELMGSEANAADIGIPSRDGIEWADYSLVFHTVPIATRLTKTEVYPTMRNFTYFYKDKFSPLQGELGFPHSGYYSGGDYERCSRKTISRPEDCSSWVSKILGAKCDITTYGLMQFFRIKAQSGMFDKAWSSKREFKCLDTMLEPVQTFNIKEDVQPGDILCIRRGKKQKVNREISYGDSGHMAVALFATDTYILALACTRDAPLMEGIGIQKINLEDEEDSDVMLLRRRG
ncbi:MAG: hypothetical protein LBI30_01550 [Holosporales bacterium]|nr:hypothetical protein [Holosporales bacterium]